MKWPRKGILIRLAIYLPLIGFLAYQGFFRRAEPEPAAPTGQEPKVRHIEGPDGEDFKIIEITPEQAREMGVEIPEKPPVVPPDDTKVPNG